MSKLIFFEIDKMWKKPSFIISVVSLLVINVFLLWYTSLPADYEPKLGAYKSLQSDIEGMTEEEKYDYIETLYQDIQGIVIVENILSFRSSDNELVKEMAQQKLDENQEIFEKYYDVYENEEYLKYTDDLMTEKSFIEEIYEEMCKVSGYQNYLDSVQETRDKLNGISIFVSANTKDSFSSRNIDKSAADYDKMRDINIKFYPSKGIATATRNNITDVLLILSVFLFVGGMIYEEKEKKLFYITRATTKGRTESIGAKLLALVLNCSIMSVLMYSANLMFFAYTTGIGELNSSIQSVAPFMESNLHINVATYILMLIVTKAIVMFCIGALITFVSIISKQSFMPYVAGAVIIAGCVALYNFIPAYSTFNYLKYLNFIGLFKTENLYGGYLNFNLLGYPVQRLGFSWIIIIVYILIGVSLSVISFLKCTNMELKKISIPFSRKFRPHSNLLIHESYKIFVTNKAAMILVIFILLIGYRHITGSYSPSVKEEYYQSIMLQLEGKLTNEKESLIESEEKRYKEAFDQIAKIDEMIASGQIDQFAGENMKSIYYSEVAFYPAFQRVLNQYEYVKETEGIFVYDTGYLYLFGIIDNDCLMDLILVILCIILCFSNVMAMEYQKKSWYLFAATTKGKKRIICNKKIVCVISTVVLSIVTWGFMVMQIVKVYPIHQLLASIKSIPAYRDISFNIPILVGMFIMVAVQIFTLVFILMIVMFLSDKLKNQLQTLFVSVLMFAIPLILKAMGLDFAQWFSVYPIYTMPNFIISEGGSVIVAVYIIVMAVGIFGASHLIGRVEKRTCKEMVK